MCVRSVRTTGNSYARAAAGQAAIGAARTATFLGERYTRIACRRGGAIAQAAVARSIMLIVWHLLAGPAARYHDLGPDFYASRISRDKKIRTHPPARPARPRRHHHRRRAARHPGPHSPGQARNHQPSRPQPSTPRHTSAAALLPGRIFLVRWPMRQNVPFCAPPTDCTVGIVTG
jgi:hypothetical protein